MHKIQVLLIDDNPSFALKKIGTIPEFRDKGLRPNQLAKSVPFIGDVKIEKRIVDNSKKLKPHNITTVSETIAYSAYFELKWLRNADDITRYRRLCQAVEDDFSATRLGAADGFVPEIVLFDYALTGHQDKAFLNEQDDLEILKLSVPTYTLNEILKGTRNLETIIGSDSPFVNSTELEKGLNSDNLGCIGGIMTASYFREHPCIGIATTRKSDEHLAGQEAKFIENLVKEPNQFDFTLRGNIDNLRWEVLLGRAVRNLRERIINLTKSAKLIPSYTKLTVWAAGQRADATFDFFSVYGERSLPVDGLFIDCNGAQKDTEIQTWASRLVEQMPLSPQVIQRAEDISAILLKTYFDTFEDRIVLSDYTCRSAYHDGLNDEEKKYLIEIKQRLSVEPGTQIIAKEKECSIRSLWNKNDTVQVKRFSVLLLVTIAAIKFNKQLIESEHNEKYAPLSQWEYFNIVFPKVNLGKSVILPMHCQNETDKDTITDTDRKWLASNLRTAEHEVVRGNLFQFDEWISKREKKALQSFFFEDRLFYPSWLK